MTLLDALAPLEAALLDGHRGTTEARLRLRFDDGSVEDVDPSWFFRDPSAMDALDRAALERTAGRVLDVGAGAGPHTLALEARGHTVTALEVLPGAVHVLRERGARDVRHEALADHVPDRPYDTVLLLMNGTGIAGTLSGLPRLLADAARVLAPGGTLLVDSTDPGDEEPGDGRHPGELQIQLAYRDVRGPPFPWLYVGPDDLAHAARSVGLDTRVELALDDGRYLAACVPVEGGG